ncbi:MAG: histidine kinase [Lachnospiraceae bacterium]|nr:histidine kinase [Lachnospiraceae bacterium]
MSEGLRNANIVVAVAGLVISIIGLMQALFGRFMEKDTRGFFLSFFGILCTYDIFILARALTWYNTGPGWAILSRIVFFGQALLSSILAFLITGFLLYQSGHEQWWKQRVFFVAYVLWCVYALILFYAQFSKVVYYVDDQNGYHRGPIFPIIMVAPVIIMIVNLFALHQNRDRLTQKQRHAFLIYLAVPLLGIIMQTVLFGIQFIVLGTSIGAFIMYLYISVGQRDEYYKKEKENERLKVNMLLAQMQPGFIINSLNTIGQLCAEDPPRAEEAISEFTTYLEKHIDALTVDTPIPFADEMKQTEEYLSLQKLRFGGVLKVVYHLDNIDFSIPTLTLQPLVENAVIHGIRESKKGMGIVSIRSKRYKDHFEVTVEDDGVGFDISAFSQDDDSHSTMKNIRERLRSVCDGDLRIESEIGQGTKATIILPINQ